MVDRLRQLVRAIRSHSALVETVVREVVEVRGPARDACADDASAEEATSVGEHVALPDHQLRLQPVEGRGVAGTEHPILDRADGRELVDQSGALVGRQDPTCGMGVAEETECDVSALADVESKLELNEVAREGSASLWDSPRAGGGRGVR